MSKLPYTEVRICKTNPKDWFVYFEFTYNGKVYPRRYRAGINRYPVNKRWKEAVALRDARTLWLQAGWNPIIDPEFKNRDVPKVEILQKMGLNDALDFALKNGKYSEETRRTYRSPLNFIKLSAKRLNLSHLPVTDLKRAHVKLILENLYELKKQLIKGGRKNLKELSDHAYNKHTDTFRAMLTVLLEWEFVDFNAASKITHFELGESDKYATWTAEEKMAVVDHLADNHPTFFTYLMALYYTGMRPAELLALKVGDIDLKNSNIKIVPDKERRNSKTKVIRNVPICDHLHALLKPYDLENVDADWFVFGSPFASGQGNRGSKLNNGLQEFGAKRKDCFLPSPTRIRRDTVTRLFNEIVRQTLGIDKYMYALKHTGADDNILAGIPLEALQRKFGHGSRYMTEVYAKKVKDIYRQTIIKDTVEFLSKNKPSLKPAPTADLTGDPISPYRPMMRVV